MSKVFKSVSELMWWIRKVTNLYLREEIQVIGEIRSARINKRGVLDIELVESSKGRKGNYTYQINCQFEDPHTLKDTLKINNFRELEGEEYLISGYLSFRVTQNRYVIEAIDIEPYGKGSIEKHRAAILELLKQEGLYPVRKIASLSELQEPILRIALIGSPNTRGLTDFVVNVMNSKILPDLNYFPVAVEGATAAQKIVRAIEEANETTSQVIVIVRGGGAQGSLLYLENEELARSICKSSIPVMVAVGHTEDVTLLDYVAHLSVETPTAAGREIAEVNNGYLEQCSQLEKNTASAFIRLMNTYHNKMLQKTKLISAYGVDRYISRYNREMTVEYAKLDKALKDFRSYKSMVLRLKQDKIASFVNRKVDRFHLILKYHAERMARNKNQVERKFKVFSEVLSSVAFEMASLISKDAVRVSKGESYLIATTNRLMKSAEQKTREYIAKVRSINPIHSMVKGGAIVTNELGKAVTTIEQVNVGDELKLRLADGVILSEVKEKIPNKKRIPEGVK
ncbi:exodeoxyribonuclease VII large subunit [Kosmotoga pacifica]|uniref:Exodeoxyribonuclease 7 large subunit n=1 Tax=Kosmotoga pacifica TaxID=1330330 RepID=A0A0G2ZC95_9BACT|nr:exodeoxyribonuclease VII large subunit [Kosmotoga pacifica]AKI97159.1 hypothetical protein IX53_04290 [Kosmotoga pacifica]